jgi:hypothetical protein
MRDQVGHGLTPQGRVAGVVILGVVRKTNISSRKTVRTERTNT